VIPVRGRVVQLLAGFDLMPGSSLRLTDRAAERLADHLLPVFRDVIGQAYAEGREDRDRLRRERDEAYALLVELAEAVGGLLPPGTSPGPKLREVVERVRAHVRQ
jgi:hypothetical protein